MSSPSTQRKLFLASILKKLQDFVLKQNIFLFRPVLNILICWTFIITFNFIKTTITNLFYATISILAW